MSKSLASVADKLIKLRQIPDTHLPSTLKHATKLQNIR